MVETLCFCFCKCIKTSLWDIYLEDTSVPEFATVSTPEPSSCPTYQYDPWSKFSATESQISQEVRSYFFLLRDCWSFC